MHCLYCGDCCLRISPLGIPCPKLEKRENFYFCSDYQNRPIKCKNYNYYDYRFCPIGINKLKIILISEIQIRINKGYAMLKFNLSDSKEALQKLLDEK